LADFNPSVPSLTLCLSTSGQAIGAVGEPRPGGTRVPREVSSTAGPVKKMVYRFGAFTLDTNCEVLLVADGTEVPLRPKSFTLLLLLVENAGRTVSKEKIMASVWPNLFVTENNINQCVHEIRRAFGAGAKHILRTRPRRGYLLDAAVIAVLSRPCSPRVGLIEPDAIPTSSS
jgi:DNA-binding winged helix-turn-helix (wHTH) protein